MASVSVPSQRRVSCTTSPPRATVSRWRMASYSRAACMPLKVFMFFISTFTPSSFAPAGRMEMFTSERMFPSSRLQSDMSAYVSISFSADRYAIASSAEAMSGSETISMSGVPPRLKSTHEYPAWCSIFAASSSRWMWLMRMVFGPAGVDISTPPPMHSGLAFSDIW